MYAPRPKLLVPYRGYLVAATVLFMLGLLLGIAAAVFYPELIQQAFAQVEEQLRSLGEDIFSNQLGQGIGILFLHNLRALGLIAILGLVLGIYPVFAMLLNGLIIGVVGAVAVPATSLAAFLAGIIPHGILEIPAILIGAAVGLRLGLAPLFNRKNSPFAAPRPNAWQGYRREFAAAARVLLICAVLLVFAAVIEVAITPLIMRLAGVHI